MASDAVRRRLLVFQRNEITEHHIYRRLAAGQPPGPNRDVLERIAADELRHYNEWKTHSGEDAPPQRLRVAWYGVVSRLLGFTFAVKLMESGEEDSGTAYREVQGEIPNAEAIAREEDEHENALIALLDEERLRYAGSIVLGLNDALVELTGALAGLTLALQNTRLIALTGSITGIAAALSMAASEYLSTKTEETSQSPAKAAVYTGVAYLITVVLLVTPYLVLQSFYAALACTMITAVLIIAGFNYYISVAKDLPFKRRFFEMAGLSLGVAGFSFLVGLLLRAFLGVDV